MTFLSEAPPSSTGPFTTATWNCEAQHQMVRLTEMREDEKIGGDGTGDERRGCSMEMDMAAPLTSLASTSSPCAPLSNLESGVGRLGICLITRCYGDHKTSAVVFVQ